ncbi:magnesium transporter [Candidatus Woesearchaeota archaeon]|nr:magnesium transporter [Candidatus Woesearchaeota archaeon]
MNSTNMQQQQYAQPRHRQETIIKEIGSFLRELEETKKSREITYFSQLLGTKIYDADNHHIGRLQDLVVTSGEKFPVVEALICQHGKFTIKIMWQFIAAFNTHINLTLPFYKIPKEKIQDNDILIGATIIDKQLVDINGLKVIRVNDIALAKIKGRLNLVSIDIGMRGILRRIGLQKVSGWLGIKDQLVPWSNIEPLHDSLKRIRINVSMPHIDELHPADVADLLEELSMKERQSVFKSINSRTAARILEEAEDFVKKSVANSLEERRAALIIEKMSRHKAADILSLIDDEKKERLLGLMKLEVAAAIRELLTYPAESAGRFMSLRYVAIPKHFTIRRTIEYLRRMDLKPRILHYVYVVDELNALAGVLSLRDIVLAHPEALAQDIMKRRVISIKTKAGVKDATAIMAKYDLLGLPVIDSERKIKGILNIEEVFTESGTRVAEEPIAQPLPKYKNIFREIGAVLRDIDEFIRIKQIERLKGLKDRGIKLSFDKQKIIDDETKH